MTPESDGLLRFNALPAEAAAAELRKCCGSARWVRAICAQRPFASVEQLCGAAGQIWSGLDSEDWLEAFRHHPRIGEKKGAAGNLSAALQWSAGEQAGVANSAEQIQSGLAAGNRAYEARFGYIFIVCATGKSAEEMLALLENRLQNDPGAELRIAAAEQAKIARLRLLKLLRGE